MITLIYRGIIAIILIFTVLNMYTDKKISNQLNAALIIFPLLLRMLMIK